MYYEFTFDNKTNCLILQKDNKLIDCKFYNRFDNITFKQLYKDSKQIAKENNIKEHAINFTNFKEVI